MQFKHMFTIYIIKSAHRANAREILDRENNRDNKKRAMAHVAIIEHNARHVTSLKIVWKNLLLKYADVYVNESWLENTCMLFILLLLMSSV